MPEIKKAIIYAGRKNRPAKKNPMKYITIHETGNYADGADAKAHAYYLRTTTQKTSWHYSVDSKEIYQHLPDNETAFHAGDGADGTGNSQSIGIELCVNYDGNFHDTLENGVWLVRKLMAEHEIPIENVVQHHFWSGKNCPENLRLGGWDEFILRCSQPVTDTPSDWAKDAWSRAIELGVTDGLRPKDNCTREELVTMLYRAGVLEECACQK